LTQDEKDRIIQMRTDSMSYAKIALIIGISENTIKSFCRRNNINIAPKTVYEEIRGIHTVCRQCGKPLTHTAKGQPKKFCSDACRRMWWKANENLLNKKAYYMLTCAGCGTEFQSYGNRNRKFCGHPCFIKNRFQKGADGHDA